MNNPFASRWLPFGCLVLLSFVLARGSATSESGEDEAACPREETSGFARLRAATGTVRPPGDHGCKPVEIVPGLWTAHFHDIDSPEKLRSSAPGVTCVVNCATDKCKLVDYGEQVRVVAIDALLDDPDEMKKVDCMEEGEAKDAARAALPTFLPEARRPGPLSGPGGYPGGPGGGGARAGGPLTARVGDAFCRHQMSAGDAKKDFEFVNGLIEDTRSKGGVTLVHCHASISRSAAFALAYIMHARGVSAAEAVAIMRPRWEATWPNDRFARQLLEYEAELRAAGRLG